MSPLRMCMIPSHDLGREVGDLHEALLAEFAGDRTEDAGAARVLLVVDQHDRVAVEAHVTAVVAAGGALDADDHALDDVAGLDVAARDRLLDARDDDVTEARVAALVAAKD